jgi:N-acetylmuramoyl-L-alanine amidase
MKIENHRLSHEAGEQPILFKSTPNHSGAFKTGLPDTVIIHYTAGASLESSVNWLRKPEARASAHLVIGKTGKVVQLLPFDTIGWHAGRSEWKGRTSMNQYSIGIEMDNAGVLEQRLDGYYTHFGKRIPDAEVVITKHQHHAVAKAWEAFTPQQLEKVEEVCLALKAHYPMVELLGHEDIAPGRKIDPGPAFPLFQLRGRVLEGRGALEEEGRAVVTASALNIRSAPHSQASKLMDPLQKGTAVQVLETQGKWSKVKVEVTGWVSSDWLTGGTK